MEKNMELVLRKAWSRYGIKLIEIIDKKNRTIDDLKRYKKLKHHYNRLKQEIG